MADFGPFPLKGSAAPTFYHSLWRMGRIYMFRLLHSGQGCHGQLLGALTEGAVVWWLNPHGEEVAAWSEQWMGGACSPKQTWSYGPCRPPSNGLRVSLGTSQMRIVGRLLVWRWRLHLPAVLYDGRPYWRVLEPCGTELVERAASGGHGKTPPPHNCLIRQSSTFYY